MIIEFFMLLFIGKKEGPNAWTKSANEYNQDLEFCCLRFAGM